MLVHGIFFPPTLWKSEDNLSHSDVEVDHVRLRRTLHVFHRHHNLCVSETKRAVNFVFLNWPLAREPKEELHLSDVESQYESVEYSDSSINSRGLNEHSKLFRTHGTSPWTRFPYRAVLTGMLSCPRGSIPGSVTKLALECSNQGPEHRYMTAEVLWSKTLCKVCIYVPPFHPQKSENSLKKMLSWKRVERVRKIESESIPASRTTETIQYLGFV